MKIAPLTLRKPKSIALVFPGHRRLTVFTVDGRKDAVGVREVEHTLTQLATHCVYVSGALTSMKRCTPATSWTCHTWRGKGTRMVHEPSDTSVTSLRGALEGDSPDEAFSDLLRVVDWLAGYGVTPGSVSSMAWQLFRASLSTTLTLASDPVPSRAAFFGGRQEARVVTDGYGVAKVYQNMVAADIVAAYPTAMASGPYATGLRPVDVGTRLDPDVPGLVEATVVVPADMPFAPLPVRLAPDVIQFPTGPITGTWTWAELAAAEALGCFVTVTKCWAPRSTVDLFGPWWRIALAGRRHFRTPGSLTLFKSVCNSLWGQFAMNGEDIGSTRWADDRGEVPIHLEHAPRSMPHAWTTHIAAETSSRVRIRLLREGLYQSSAGHPVHADTDGIIARASRPIPTPCGNAPGEWRPKASMATVDIRAPQLYRWTCGKGCGVTHAKYHYVAAGVTAGSAAQVFDQEASIATRISYRYVTDLVIPTTHSDDPERLRLMTEAKMLSGVA